METARCKDNRWAALSEMEPVRSKDTRLAAQGPSSYCHTALSYQVVHMIARPSVARRLDPALSPLSSARVTGLLGISRRSGKSQASKQTPYGLRMSQGHVSIDNDNVAKNNEKANNFARLEPSCSGTELKSPELEQGPRPVFARKRQY